MVPKINKDKRTSWSGIEEIAIINAKNSEKIGVVFAAFILLYKNIKNIVDMMVLSVIAAVDHDV